MKKTELIRLDPACFEPDQLSSPAQWIRAGKLVAFPTETVYGLGANALNADACNAIFEAKGRPHDNPLIVHVSNADACKEYSFCEEYPVFKKIAQRFMPGPLTVVVRKRSIIPDAVTVGLDTVALRCPSNPIARELIKQSGVPIAAPSANRSGRPSPTTASHVMEDMNGRIACIIDGGPCEVGVESTVIALKSDGIHLLRPGAVTREMLLELGENVIVSSAVLSAINANETVESPGMKYRHYAPKAPCSMVEGEDEDVIAFFQKKLDEGCGILCFTEDIPKLSPSDRVISMGSKDDLSQQAHVLFDALRNFDSMGVPKIFVRKTKESNLGLAVTNRLLRACAFDIIQV